VSFSRNKSLRFEELRNKLLKFLQKEIDFLNFLKFDDKPEAQKLL
jgi:hypothetical protein